MIDSRITTVDNPHDPFDDFDNWYAWDERSGYHTTSFLARIIKNSDDMSEYDQHLVFEQAVDEMVQENVTGMYRKVSREISDL